MLASTQVLHLKVEYVGIFSGQRTTALKSSGRDTHRRIVLACPAPFLIHIPSIEICTHFI